MFRSLLLLGVQIVGAELCPREGFDPYTLPFAGEVYRSSRGTNGGTNTFIVTKKCEYQIKGQNVGGTEKFALIEDWLERAAELYDASLVANGAALTGVAPVATDASTQACAPFWCVTLLQGNAVSGADKTWTFATEAYASNFLAFILDLVAVPAVWETSDVETCGSGPFCYDTAPDFHCYVDPISQNCGAYDFIAEDSSGAGTILVDTADVWPWFETCFGSFPGCQRRNGGTFNYGTPFRTVFYHANSGKYRFKLSGSGVGGSIQWECDTEQQALDMKAFADAAADAPESLFAISPPQGPCLAPTATPTSTPTATPTWTPTSTPTMPQGPVVLSSCKAHLDAGSTQDGYYWINPADPFEVYCDQTTTMTRRDGVTETGGWMLFLNSADNYFVRPVDTVEVDAYGASTDAHWTYIRDSMEFGMLVVTSYPQFVGVADRKFFVSKLTMDNTLSSCATPSALSTLTPWEEADVGTNIQPANIQGLYLRKVSADPEPSGYPSNNWYQYNLWARDVGCNGVGGDYCLVRVRYIPDTYGTALYNQCAPGVNWDSWGYPGVLIANDHEEAKYFFR